MCVRYYPKWSTVRSSGSVGRFGRQVAILVVAERRGLSAPGAAGCPWLREQSRSSFTDHVIEITGQPDGLHVVFSFDDPNDASRPAEETKQIFGWKWLRDHGEDSGSIDPDTWQRRVDTFAIPDDICAEYLTPDDNGLLIDWTDGSQSTHSWALLADIAAAQRVAVPTPRSVTIPQTVDRQLWRSAPGDLAAPIPNELFLNNDNALGVWLAVLHRRGYGLIADVPAGHDAVTAIADRIGYVRPTVFGQIWDLNSDVTDHADTAYTTTYLEPHTDGTYMHDAPGLQLFCCQERDGTGGQSILVDGFAAVAELPPEQADLLAAIPVPGHYIEPGVHLATERAPLRVDAAGVLVQVSFNNYDRAPFMLQPDDQARFYDAYQALHDLLIDERRWLKIDWEPGQMLVIDNWRVMHGRTGYTGSRSFLGAYMNHEDFESKLRVLSGR